MSIGNGKEEASKNEMTDGKGDIGGTGLRRDQNVRRTESVIAHGPSGAGSQPLLNMLEGVRDDRDMI